jgi:sensor histidine kinase regulating citrate/malate metabolism
MDWAKNYAAAVTICDKEGIITYMNDQAAVMFANNGGYDLIGKCLFECHLQSSNDKMAEIIQTGKPNAYTTEKKGKKRLIYQSPHIENGEVLGIVELAIEIPFTMPHHVRS